MAAQQPSGPGAGLCERRAGSRRGLSAYLPRHARAAIEAEEGSGGARVEALAADPRHRYGRRRRAPPRQDEGCAVGRATARRLMPRAGGVVPRPTRHGPVTPDRGHGEAGAPHLRARRVDGATPDHVGGAIAATCGRRRAGGRGRRWWPGRPVT
jgi:hypothetical protein